MASGREVKCAAGGGGDGDRIGGDRVGLSFRNQRPEFIKSGLAGLTADYDILRNVVRRNETTGRTLSLIAKQRPRRGRRGAERTTNGGCPRTPDWMASGRQVKCAAGVGGDGGRIGGKRVSRRFAKCLEGVGWDDWWDVSKPRKEVGP